jgi:YidC/Oxa1 family membrane protein insertase
MENLRLILVFSLAAVLFLIYQAWMVDYRSDRLVSSQGSAPTTAAKGSDATPGVPLAVTPNEPASVQGTANTLLPTDTGLVAAPAPVTVETDVLRVQISPKGGSVTGAWLLDYPLSPEQPSQKVQLLKMDTPNMFVAQSGLLGDKPGVLPTHEDIFHATSTSYRLGADDSTLRVELTWMGPTGIEVRKRYDFTRGSYVIATSQELLNPTSATVVVREYNQLLRTDYTDPNATRFVNTYTGGVYYTPETKYKKVSFNAMTEGKLDLTAADGWVAMMQHYFFAAWVPPPAVAETFYTNVLDNSRFIIGKWSPTATVSPGGNYTFVDRLYVGPKLQDSLANIAPGLELTVDYGWLTVIAQPIHWLLSMIHAVVGNWGWSIIVLTILIKLAFYKLSETSYKSMAGMRQITPRIQAIKDRYGDDKERLNQAMMELYKTEKINPLGGCLPIVVQIPVFIALYWVLLESVELRQAPWILWIHNLSAPDPFYILPLIMGVSMFVQQRLNPAPPDPMQAKIMMSLPFVFTVFFAFFPSGLVLYWTVNNLLSIAQQWHITRAIELEAAKRKR